LALGLLLSPAPALAHHAFSAEFSRDLPLELTGKVTRVEWMNPHARFYINVEDENGQLVEWDFELSSPNGLMRRGWTRNSLQQGDTVTVTGFRAKNAPHVGNASTVVLADGTRVFAGSSSEDED
jgi:hypothetical protein